MVIRRTTQRQFLLRPSKAINQCIRYCVSIAAERSGAELHALMFMSNHYHIILMDVEGRLPVFTETLNRLLAKSLNVYHSRAENFSSKLTPVGFLKQNMHGVSPELHHRAISALDSAYK